LTENILSYTNFDQGIVHIFHISSSEKNICW
jgi:hypothetical protein